MNTLVTTLPEGRFAFPRLTEIVVGKYQPRTVFDEDAMLELVVSIKAMGILQPILVRPLPSSRLDETFADRRKGDPLPVYELVSGERRWRASARAGLDTIPVLVCNLTDDQIPLAQLTENLKRSSLTPLELGFAYDRFMKDAGLTALEVAETVGCSRTHVYDMLKLITLQDDVQKAIRAKAVDVSAALLIARIPDYALQTKALTYATTKDDAGHDISIRAFQTWLRDNVMLDLTPGKVPFPIDVKTLTAAGSCKDCTTRTGHDPDLFADVKSDMCTHPPCYHLKAQAHKDVLAAQVAAIPKASNRNVDEQEGLGLESTLAQDARANQSADKTADRLKSDIEAIKAGQALAIHKAQRTACFDMLIDHIYDRTNDNKAQSLLPVELLRRWLQRQVSDWESEDLAVALDMPPCGDTPIDEYETSCMLRIGRADDADIYRYMAAMLLLPDRDTHASHIDRVKEPLLINAFAHELGIDIEAVRDEVAQDVEDEMKTKIAAINKQIKAAKTTSTPPPAGAANDDAAADAKKSKPAAPASASRKAKVTAQEAISGIAAAMQSIEAEPTGASLEGSGRSTIDNLMRLAVGAKVKVLDGKHAGKQGVVASEVSTEMWNITLNSGVGLPFATYLPTKSLQVIA